MTEKLCISEGEKINLIQQVIVSVSYYHQAYY